MLFQSPYLITQATGSADGVERLEVSTDAGKIWKPAELKDFGSAVGGNVQGLTITTVGVAILLFRLVIPAKSQACPGVPRFALWVSIAV